MANAKEIQHRIKSVANTKKITKAMEMVAAAKMRRAIEAVLRTRTYANLSWTTVINLSRSIQGGKNLHPLLTKKGSVKRVGVVVMASNRGLCGGFNSAILNKVHNSIKKHCKNENNEDVESEIIVIGKKGFALHTRYGYKVVADFPKLDIVSEVGEVRPVARMIIDDFLSGQYDKIMVGYTDYISASSQVPRVKQILPVDLQASEDHLGIVGPDTRIGVDKRYIKEKEDKYLRDNDKYVFTFEPSPEEVLEEMLPRLIEIQLFQALLESNASEHSARMSAMHQATDAAGELVEELKLSYNKARQAGITAEIAEISAGASALK